MPGVRFIQLTLFLVLLTMYCFAVPMDSGSKIDKRSILLSGKKANDFLSRDRRLPPGVCVTCDSSLECAEECEEDREHTPPSQQLFPHHKQKSKHG